MGLVVIMLAAIAAYLALAARGRAPQRDVSIL
jgi:hypothetical protein